MQADSRIDKDLANKLDSLLKHGSLDGETEILKILEDLSERLRSLENKEVKLMVTEDHKEERKNRLHRAWGKDPWNDPERTE